MPIITGAAAALATAIGITGYLLSTDPATNHPAPSDPSSHVTARVSQPTSIGAVADTNGGTAERIVIHRSASPSSEGIMLLSMEADDLDAFNIHSDALVELRAAIGGADSMGACARGTICVWENGKRREVTFGSQDAPLPAMVTTPDGKGRYITIPSIREIDVNDLIPMETATSDGKVVMWFPPTARIVTQLPEDIAENIRIVPFGDGAEVRTFRFDMNNTDIDINIPNVVNIDSILRSIKSSLGGLDSVMVSNLCRTAAPDSAFTLVTRNLFADSLVQIFTDSINAPHQQRITIRRLNMNRPLPKRLDTADRVQRSITSNIIIIRRTKGTDREVSSGDQHLQETRSADGAMQITSVYPHPTSDGAATIAFELAEERVLTIDLLDLNGRKIATLAGGLRKARGTCQVVFTLSGIPAGMYLVNVTTDKGERTVQRLVIQ